MLVVESEPGRWFSSGHDLRDVFRREGKSRVEARSEPELRELFGACTELMLTLRNLRQPTVAVVDGHAASAGLQLVASCDIVLASTSSQFSAPGSRRGRFCHTPGLNHSRLNVCAAAPHTNSGLSPQVWHWRSG